MANDTYITSVSSFSDSVTTTLSAFNDLYTISVSSFPDVYTTEIKEARDGIDGTNGIDGNTPILSATDTSLEISTDNGATFSPLVSYQTIGDAITINSSAIVDASTTFVTLTGDQSISGLKTFENLSVNDTQEPTETPRDIFTVNGVNGNFLTVQDNGITKVSNLGDMGFNWYLLGNIDATDGFFNVIQTESVYCNNIYAYNTDSVNIGANVNLTGSLSATGPIYANGNQVLTTVTPVSTLASGAALTNINAGSTIDFTKNISLTGSETITSNNASITPFTIIGASGQANLQEWKNNQGNVVGSISNTGNFNALGLQIAGQTALTYTTNTLNLGINAYWTTLNYGNSGTTKHSFTSGNVGIGSTTPNEKLTVVGNISASTTGLSGNVFTATTNLTANGTGSFISIQNQTDTSSAKIGRVRDGAALEYGGVWLNQTNPTTSNYAFLGDGSSSYFNAPGGNLYFRINNSSKMTIVGSNNNVGINTLTPNEKLTVVGNISASGTATATNLVYNTGDQTIAGIKTFSNNIVGNGTSNTLPNQTFDISSNVLTRSYLDQRAPFTATSLQQRLTADDVYQFGVVEHFNDYTEVQSSTNAYTYTGTVTGAGGSFGQGFNDGGSPDVMINYPQGNDLYSCRGIVQPQASGTLNSAFVFAPYLSIGQYRGLYYTSNVSWRMMFAQNDPTTYYRFGVQVPMGGSSGANFTIAQRALCFDGSVSPNFFFATPSNRTYTTSTSADTGIPCLSGIWCNLYMDFVPHPTIYNNLSVIDVTVNYPLSGLRYTYRFTPTDSVNGLASNGWWKQQSTGIVIGQQDARGGSIARKAMLVDWVYVKTAPLSSFSYPANWNSTRFLK